MQMRMNSAYLSSNSFCNLMPKFLLTISPCGKIQSAENSLEKKKNKRQSKFFNLRIQFSHPLNAYKGNSTHQRKLRSFVYTNDRTLRVDVQLLLAFSLWWTCVSPARKTLWENFAIFFPNYPKSYSTNVKLVVYPEYRLDTRNGT